MKNLLSSLFSGGFRRFPTPAIRMREKSIRSISCSTSRPKDLDFSNSIRFQWTGKDRFETKAGGKKAKRFLREKLSNNPPPWS
jgi:hypothetical protein